MLALEGSTAHMLQPDRLPLSDASMIIVQAEPTRSSVSADPRTDSLRTIAHDIAVASAGAAVIAIPALPSHLAARLTEEIARTLAAPTDVPARPARARPPPARDCLRRRRPEDAVAARALPAFDICLYMGV